MIALISGTVAVRRADHVVIDCGGVGYQLAVSAQTLRHVPAVGLVEPGEQVQQRGYSAARRTDQRHQLAGIESEADAAQGNDFSVVGVIESIKLRRRE